MQPTSEVVLSTDVGGGTFVSFGVESVGPYNLQKVRLRSGVTCCLPALLYAFDDFYVVLGSKKPNQQIQFY